MVGIIEQPEGRLAPEHAAHRLVHEGDGDAPRPDQSREIVHVDAAHHVHIDAGLEGELPRFGARARDAVIAELVDRRPVAHHEAPEAPLAAEHRGHEPGAGGARDPADLVEGRHDATGACVQGGVVRRQVHFAQRPLGQIDGVVVPAALGAAIGGKMFYGGEHRVGRARIGALKAPDARRGHGRSQVGILTRAFGDATPAGIAGDIHHRGERPVHTGGRGLPGGDVSGRLHRFRVP